MQTMTLEHVKAGDRVMTMRRTGQTEQSPMRYTFYTVTKVTKRRICVGIREYDRLTGKPVANAYGWSPIQPVTQAALDWEAEHTRKSQESKRERETYNARPDVQIVRRLTSMEHETWLAIGLHRLQKIIELIDTPVPAGVEQESKCSSCGDTTGVCECM